MGQQLACSDSMDNLLGAVFPARDRQAVTIHMIRGVESCCGLKQGTALGSVRVSEAKPGHQDVGLGEGIED